MSVTRTQSQTLAAISPGGGAMPFRRPRRLNRLQRRLLLYLIVSLVIVTPVLAAPLFTDFEPNKQNILERLKPAGAELRDGRTAWLGTDQLGRDMWSRILYGGRISLFISVTGVLLAAAIGIALGLIAGYGGTVVDSAIMRVVDIQLGFPGLLLAIVLAAALGPGLTNVILALGIARWTTYTRVLRASVLSLKKEEYVHAARVIGATGPRIAIRHILPNTISSLIVIAALHLGQMILAESALSFIGLGVQPPTPSWGAMIDDGREYITSAWWLITFPGLAITITVLAFGLLGDAIRDAVDPHLRSRGD
jgi:peptide/nickel transport system permease protein